MPQVLAKTLADVSPIGCKIHRFGVFHQVLIALALVNLRIFLIVQHCRTFALFPCQAREPNTPCFSALLPALPRPRSSVGVVDLQAKRSEALTSELPSLMCNSYAL